MLRKMNAPVQVGVLLCGFLLAFLPVAAKANAPTPIAYMVVGNDPSVSEKFTQRIGELLKEQTGYVLREQFPSAKLIVYVNQDVNDRINPKGYSVAVAHVSNVQAYFLGKKLLVDKPTDDQTVRDAVVAMLSRACWIT